MNARKLVRYAAGYTAVAVVGVAAGCSLALTGSRADTDQPPGGSDSVYSGDVANGFGSFTMRGHVSGLVPGEERVLRVLVSNPSKWPIRLLTVDVAAERASGTCRAGANLSIGSYDSRRPHARTIIVQGRSKAVLSLPIEMVNAPHRNQDSCKGESFPLRFAGEARAVPLQSATGPP